MTRRNLFQAAIAALGGLALPWRKPETPVSAIGYADEAGKRRTFDPVTLKVRKLRLNVWLAQEWEQA